MIVSNMINSILYCLPALGWGLMPVISKKAGGKPFEQLLGTTITALFFGILINFIFTPQYTKFGFLVCIASGFFWSLGQLLQFVALKGNEVSKVMPLSNGTQLVFTLISSGVLLGEWKNSVEVIMSFVAIVLLVIAMILFSKKVGEEANEIKISFKTLLIIIVSSICLATYVSISNFFHIEGVVVFFPQSIGMFLTSAIFFIFEKNNGSLINVAKNTSTGFSWCIANLSVFYAASKIGLGLSYTISQLCIFISVFGGYFILGEKKNKREIINICIGFCLFLASILILSKFK